jgi:hypothetical protein
MIENVAIAATWRKSRYSGSGGTGSGNCVEAALLFGGRAALRDSKAPDGGVVTVSGVAWSSYLTAVKSGSYDR